METLVASSWSRFLMLIRLIFDFNVDGSAEALVMVGGLHLTIYLLLRMTRMKRMKVVKKASSFSEELVAEQVPSQEDERTGSSEDDLSTSIPSEIEANSGVDASGSTDQSQWTEISSTEKAQKQEQAQFEKDMCERLVGDDWLVYKREWVCFNRKLAEGVQAEIYAATLQPLTVDNRYMPRVKVAVKKFKKIEGVSQGHNPPGLRSLKCVNVCRPAGIFFDNGQLCLVMPRLRGDLRTVIDKRMKLHKQMKLHRAPPFPNPVAVHIIKQLAMGLKGLHEVGIYHRDLKAANILVEKKKWKGLDSYNVFISDFESSEHVTGTTFYRAPEVIRQRSRLPKHEWAAADVYSFGMMCYEVLTGEVPLIGDNMFSYSMALSGHRPELPPGTVPDDLRIMIERCWHEDPQRRPTTFDIIRYMKRIDNNGMYIPAPMIAGMEFMVTVLDFTFQLLFFLLHQLHPLQKFLDVTLLVSWSAEGISFEPSESNLQADWMLSREMVRAPEVRTNFYAEKAHQCRIALTDELHIDQKKALLRDFVVSQLLRGVLMQNVYRESEAIIRHMSDNKHRWALERHLFFVCVKHRLRYEVDEYHLLYLEFLLRWGSWRIILLSGFDIFLWYRKMTPTIGIGLLFMPYFGAIAHLQVYWRLLYFVCIYFFRAHPQLYWRLLYYVGIFHCYAHLVGDGEGFKYLCLLDLVNIFVHNYAACKEANLSPQFYFQPINSSIY